MRIMYFLFLIKEKIHNACVRNEKIHKLIIGLHSAGSLCTGL